VWSVPWNQESLRDPIDAGEKRVGDFAIALSLNIGYFNWLAYSGRPTRPKSSAACHRDHRILMIPPFPSLHRAISRHNNGGRTRIAQTGFLSVRNQWESPFTSFRGFDLRLAEFH
jgi:hypothetical protein